MKDVQDLYTENLKIAKGIKEELNKRRDLSCSCIGELNTVKIVVVAVDYRATNYPRLSGLKQ